MSFYNQHENTQFCTHISTDCTRIRSSNHYPPSAFFNSKWGREEAAGRHRMALEAEESDSLLQPAKLPSQKLRRKKSMVQKKLACPTLQSVRIISPLDQMATRRPSRTQLYSPPPLAEVEKYARRALPAIPVSHHKTPPLRSKPQTESPPRSTTAISPYSQPPIPMSSRLSLEKPLLVTVDDRSFAARAANDARFLKAMWGVEVRQTGKRDSLTGKVEVEIKRLEA